MKERIQKLFQNKTFRIVLILLAALLLLLAVWKVFFSNRTQTTVGGYKPTEMESRLSRILSEIDGVGQTKVLIGEENGVPVSAIIVFDGADAILTRMRVIEATANALHIPPTEVLVYPSV